MAGPIVPGGVYLIGVSREGCHKIGQSHRPRARVSELRYTERDRRLKVLHVITTCDREWLEAYLHVAFRHGHVRGDWFYLTDEEVAWLKALSSVNTVADLPDAVVELYEFHRGPDQDDFVKRRRLKL